MVNADKTVRELLDKLLCAKNGRGHIETWKICGMCHASSECPDCCRNCKRDNGCYGQTCGLILAKEGVTSYKSETARFEAWMGIVEVPAMEHLRKYLIKTSENGSKI